MGETIRRRTRGYAALALIGEPPPPPSPPSRPAQAPTLFLTGPRLGPPTLDDLIALSKAMTHRDPTPTEIARAEQILADRSQTRG